MHLGVFPGDKHKVFIKDIDEKFILEYIKEAIINEKEERVWKSEKSTTFEIP